MHFTRPRISYKWSVAVRRGNVASAAYIACLIVMRSESPDINQCARGQRHPSVCTTVELGCIAAENKNRLRDIQPEGGMYKPLEAQAGMGQAGADRLKQSTCASGKGKRVILGIVQGSLERIIIQCRIQLPHRRKTIHQPCERDSASPKLPYLLRRVSLEYSPPSTLLSDV